MIRFIKQEAEEKARELMFEAEEEFNLTKQQMVQQEKARLNKDFERKEQSLETKKKIEYSQKLNEVRIRVLTSRQQGMDSVIDEARKKLTALTKDTAGYKALLAKLIAQGMKTLDLPVCAVRCRKEDQAQVQAVLEEAKALFAKATGKPAPKVSVDAKRHLPSGPSEKDDADTRTCLGGVAIASEDGRIIVNNTLDDRLNIIVGGNLPSIREALYGA